MYLNHNGKLLELLHYQLKVPQMVVVVEGVVEDHLILLELMLDKLNLSGTELFIMLKISVINVMVTKRMDPLEVILYNCLILMEILSKKKKNLK